MCSSSDATEPTTAIGAERTPLPASVRRLAYCGVSTDCAGHEEVGALAPADPTARARSIVRHDRITEAVVLATCNRVEVYVSARTPADRETALSVARDALGADGSARTHVGRDVVEHLCRVACGLDSEVVGEDHVLGQVRRAFEAAEDDLAGGVLSRVADAAVAVGQESRAETGINEGHVGYGSAACEAIAETVAEPDRLVVVGAGDIAQSVTRAATHRWDARIDVVNRSPAPALASDDGRYWTLSELEAALAGADAVVTATGSPEPVLEGGHADVLKDGTPVVDLAAPPDVDEALAATVPTTSLAAVQARTDGNAEQRREAVPAVERRVAGAVERFVARERESRAEDAIRELHSEAASIRASELERARHRLADGDAEAETVLADFASALTSRLLAEPTANLKAAARDGEDRTVDAARRLFDLQDGEDE